MFQFCGLILHVVILFFSSQTVSTSTSSLNIAGCGVSTVRVPRIVGGDSSPKGSWPWMVSLRLLSDGVYKHHCGASLVTQQWVLTAAHCFNISQNSLQWRAMLGDYRPMSLEQEEYESDVVLVILHPQFDSSQHGNDIALVRLAPSWVLEKSTPICLPRLFEDVIGDGSRCYVTGWGDTQGMLTEYIRSSTGDQASLQQVKLPVIDKEECGTWYNERIAPDAFCAGYAVGGRDSCKGDSGGPYTCPQNGVWVLGGVVSWGKDCGVTHQPGVYTSVGFHLPWIQHIISTYDHILELADM